jgi:phosphate-selective porin OprO/OprP
VGGYFRSIAPKRPVFEKGRFSYSDLDSHLARGGRFARFTPMVNWYLSDNVAWEAACGYGRLDKFNLNGSTQFFQTRLQLVL